MQFASLEFALFLGGVLFLLGFQRTSLRCRKLLLLVASYFFYGCFSPAFLLLLVVFSLVTQASAWLTAKQAARSGRINWVVPLYVAFALGDLAFFKYYSFLFEWSESLSAMYGLGGTFLPELTLAMPLGISFFTFQGLGYVIDVKRDPEQYSSSWLDALLFLAFFPCLLSGPILRARAFLPQLSGAPNNAPDWRDCVWLLLVGLLKKVALSSYLSEHVTRAFFNSPDSFSSLGLAGGALAYTAQIYLDFSGYSDMAMGVAGLLGFRIPLNFDRPYAAASPRAFWKGWHISLSTWLRDYLYIPLGGNRAGRLRTSANLLVTMGLGGLWHGANWTFAVWGLLHGGVLVVLHLLDPGKDRGPQGWRRGVAWLATFAFINLTWIFFGASDVQSAWNILGRMASLNAPGDGVPLAAWVLSLSVVAVQWLPSGTLRQSPDWFRDLPAPVGAALAGWLAALCIRLGPDGVLPFIYFQF